MTHHAALPRLAREARRKEAGRLFCRGVSQAEVARRFGVSTAAACIWHAAWKADGMKGLASKGPPGFPSALDGKARKRFKAAILKGPLSHGYPTDLWTLQRLAEVLKKETGVSFGPVRTWQVVRELGFTPQKPRVRAKERDERAIKRWKTRTLPGLKKMGGPAWVFAGI